MRRLRGRRARARRAGAARRLRQPRGGARADRPRPQQPSRRAALAGRPRRRRVRIAVVTHGQASSPFWAIVRNGVDAAGAPDGRARSPTVRPTIYSVSRMSELIDQAVASQAGRARRLDPRARPRPRDPARRSRPASRSCRSTRAPTCGRQLGVLAHVGQPEDAGGAAGPGGGWRRAGVRNALCINQQVEQQGARGPAARRSRTRDAQGRRPRARVPARRRGPPTPRRASRRRDRPRRRRRRCSASAPRLGGGARRQGARRPRGAASRSARSTSAPDVLEASRTGKIAFAVDQQAYLQGYMPIDDARPAGALRPLPRRRGELIATGPNFVTRRDAGRVIDLARRSIR